MILRSMPFSRSARRLAGDSRGAAATEFALSLPLLIALMFGFLESGRYIEEVHVVTNAVRDGVRFAARQPFASYGCAAGATGMVDLSGTPLGAAIRRYVRTGSVTGTVPRLQHWTNDNTITVQASCNNSGSGIYNTLVGGAPVVEIHANVPYQPIAGAIGWHIDMALHARAQSAVMGI